MAGRPKQRQIRCFLEIVRQGSIARAAESLAITQPAVSRTLADLEAILNARLMERSHNGILLTPAGETFLRYASASASALEKGVTKVAQIRSNARQTISIGILPAVASSVIPTAIRRFKDSRPNVPVQIASGTNQAMTDLLRQGELDFVVGRLGSPEEMTGLVFDPLFQEEMAAVVRREHPLLKCSGPKEIGKLIGGYTIILPLARTIVRESAEQLLLAIGAAHFEDTIETFSGEFSRSYAEQSNAVWIAPRGNVRRALEAGALAVLPLDFSATRGNIGVTTRADLRLMPLAIELVRIIHRVCRDGRSFEEASVDEIPRLPL